MFCTYGPIFEYVYGFLYIYPMKWTLKSILKYTNLESYSSSGVHQCLFILHICTVLNICVRNRLHLKSHGRKNHPALLTIKPKVEVTSKHLNSAQGNTAACVLLLMLIFCASRSAQSWRWSWTELTFDLEEIHIFFNSTAFWDQKSVCYRLFSSTDCISLIWLWSQGEFNSLLLMKLNYFLSNCRWITLPELCCEVALKR